MAVTLQTLLDDTEKHVVKVTKKFTGTTNESATAIVDVSGLSANLAGDACSEVVIEKIQAFISGVTVEILWNATTNLSCLKMDTTGSFDFTDIDGVGGLDNNAGTGKNGDVLVTTTGAASGDFFYLVVHCRKKF
jgi:hypothetical protein